jgi:hypothetical protein
MRDFLFMLAPIAAVLYFLARPDQLTNLLDWLKVFIGI